MNKISRELLSIANEAKDLDGIGCQGLHDFEDVQGNKMTLNEAIKHLEQVIPTIECSSCKNEHIQLLGWLNELKEFKKMQTSKDN